MTTNSNSQVPLFLEADSLQGGREAPTLLAWDYVRNASVLVVGATGSGKSYGLSLLLGHLSYQVEDAKIVLCDYKHDDFRFLDGAERYYAFDRCSEGLDFFYSSFEKRQSDSNPSRSFRMLVFDEWASFISMLDKREADAAKKKLSTLLMLGRSFNYHVLVSQQRADAAYFNTARDNFSVICAMGNLSRESRDMFFSGFKDELKPVRRIGEGYMLVNGAELHHFQVQRIGDHAKLEAAIRRLVT